MKPFESKQLIERLKKIEGEELKYNKLCEALKLSKKTGNAKIAQIKDLQMFCDLETLEKPTRYKVNVVYEQAIEAYKEVNGNNEYQLLFEAIVYKKFLKNKGKPIHLSSNDLLQMFYEVNENFRYACNKQLMEQLGEEYEYMPEMAYKIKQILKSWTKRRLDYMASRNQILRSEGYRLYKKVEIEKDGKKIEMYIPTDAPYNSDLEKKCGKIYAEAKENILPDKWKNGWIPPWEREAFNNEIQKLTKEEFGEAYDTIVETLVIRPIEEAWINEKLKKIYKELGKRASIKINTEVCKKIENTTQLDYATGLQRKKFIETNIKIPSKYCLRKKIYGE